MENGPGSSLFVIGWYEILSSLKDMYTRHQTKGYMSLDLIKVRYACIKNGDIPASYVSLPKGI